jgi:hypothetical protein
MLFTKYLKESEESSIKSALMKAREALDLLGQASDRLKEADAFWRSSGKQTVDLKSFKSAVEEIISTDNDEAGLRPFLDKFSTLDVLDGTDDFDDVPPGAPDQRI